MSKYITAVCAFLLFSFATSALADDIELDWNSVELGFFEKDGEDGDILHGLAVYVPGSQIATEDDFYNIIPEFCGSILGDLMEFSMQIEGAPEVYFLKLQIDFYGPKIGENETYVARSATIDLEAGECSL